MIFCCWVSLLSVFVKSRRLLVLLAVADFINNSGCGLFFFFLEPKECLILVSVSPETLSHPGQSVSQSDGGWNVLRLKKNCESCFFLLKSEWKKLNIGTVNADSWIHFTAVQYPPNYFHNGWLLFFFYPVPTITANAGSCVSLFFSNHLPQHVTLSSTPKFLCLTCRRKLCKLYFSLAVFWHLFDPFFTMT